jgi:hypothetical protein
LPSLALPVLASGLSLASSAIGLSIEDQARLAETVVVGEVLSLGPLEHPEHGIETELTLRVRDVIKGRPAAGGTLTFHTRQGTVGEVQSEAPGEARLNVGQTALVFVENVDGSATASACRRPTPARRPRKRTSATGRTPSAGPRTSGMDIRSTRV